MVEEVPSKVAKPDEFLWLEEQSTATRQWLRLQQELHRALVRTVRCRSRIKRLVTRLLSGPSLTLPLEACGQEFYGIRAPGKDHLNLVRSSDSITVQPLVRSDETNRYVSSEILGIASDGRTLSIGVRSGGRDDVSVRLIDAWNGRLIEELPSLSDCQPSLMASYRGYYYIRKRDDHYFIYSHFFRSQAEDALILGPLSLPSASCVAVQSSEDDRVILVRTHPSGLAGPVHFRTLDPCGTPLSEEVQLDVTSRPVFVGSRLLVFSKWHAPFGRVVRCSIDDLNPARWQEVVPERRYPLLRMTTAGGKLVLQYYRDLCSEVEVLEPTGKHIHTFAFPDRGSAIPAHGPSTSSSVFCEFSSPATPPVIYRLAIATKRQSVWCRAQLPKELGPVKTEWAEYRSLDNTPIRLALTARTDISPAPTRPVMLTAYGGFGIVEPPRFSARSALWVDLGGVFARAYIRGGGEFGDNWHKAAVKEKRQNAVDDFVHAAKWLIANGWCSPSRLAIVGGSNAGLLVCAAAVQQPNLFGAVVCFGPITDLLRYHLFPGSEVAIQEYGTAEVPEQAEYLGRLSPYHSVRSGCEYPSFLFISGDADTRCHPMHARKMCARLQQATSSGRPVLLDNHPERGHVSALPLDLRIETLTNQFCFLIKSLNLHVNERERFELKAEATKHCS